MAGDEGCFRGLQFSEKVVQELKQCPAKMSCYPGKWILVSAKLLIIDVLNSKGQLQKLRLSG